MWSRKELKTKSKGRIKANYWKAVLVGMILSLLLGTGSFNYSSGNHDWQEEIGISSQEESFQQLDGLDINTGILLITAIVFLAVMGLILMLIFIPLNFLVFNPLEVGSKRFFRQNLEGDARVGELCYSFDHEYKNTVKIMFFRGLHTFLWSLLFLIPGIVKAYEYRMIPYLLGDHPNMSKEEAFEESRQMMYQNKWKAFLLDVSFFGWYLLNVLTLGILGIFYINPYYHQTCAALYETLKNQEKQYE